MRLRQSLGEDEANMREAAEELIGDDPFVLNGVVSKATIEDRKETLRD